MLASVPALLSTGCGDAGLDRTGPVPATTTATPNRSIGADAAGTVKATRLFIDLDTVRGTKNLTPTQAATEGCVQTSMFAKNEQIVFRLRVVDPGTGQEVDPKSIDHITVKFKNGMELAPAVYGPHPKELPNESYWAAYFVIPQDFPVGTIDYTVTAMDREGRTGVFTPLHFAANALLTVTAAVREDLSP